MGHQAYALEVGISATLALSGFVLRATARLAQRLPPFNLYCANGRVRFGGQAAGGHPKTSPRPRQLLFAVAGIERARKCLRGEHFVRCSDSTHGLLFRGSGGVPRGGSAAVCDPNPPRPFARYRWQNEYTFQSCANFEM